MCAPHQPFPSCIRPVIFENNDAEWRFSARGSCFLVKQEDGIYAITAKHVVAGYLPSQYRILSRLGSHIMLPIRQPFTPDFYCGDKYEAVDFEDFVVVPVDMAEITGDGFDTTDACQVDESPIQWSTIKRVGVFGFPSDMNFVNFDEAIISIQPCGMIGHLTDGSIGEGMREVQFGESGELNSYDGFSGAPVFQVTDSGTIQRLLGIALRGSQDTSVSKRGHFLDIRLVAPMIRHHLKQQGIRP
jgi:hypothetical protein